MAKNLTFASIIILLIPITTVCQVVEQDPIFEQGNFLIGGGFSIGANNSETSPLDTIPRKDMDEFRSFSFSPYFGKFIKNNMLFGINLRVGFNDSERIDENISFGSRNITETDFFNVGLFIKRYYRIEGRFGVFITPQLSYFRNVSVQEFESYDVDPFNIVNSDKRDRRTTGVALSTNMGLYVRIGKKFLLETNLMGLSLSTSSSDVTELDNFSGQERGFESTSNNFNINLINTLRLDQILVFNYVF